MTKEQLEKENKLLGERCNQLLKDKGDLTDKCRELEKENAELKEYNKYLKRKRQGGIQKQYNKVAIIKQQAEQLTKAKEQLEKAVEIIRELGGIVREGVTCHYLVDYGATHRATLFIKEIKENG